MARNERFSIERSKFEEIYQVLEGLEYGSVEVVVHAGKIVEISRLEKKRYPLKKNQ